MDSSIVELIAGVVERRGLFFLVDGKYYGGVPDCGGWWMYELTPGSAEYFVTKDGCTCPANTPCKHMAAIRTGSRWS